MEEYEKRYLTAKKQFLELIYKNCKGNYPINGKPLTFDVMLDIILDVSLGKNNFDLLIFLFFNFSQYEDFSNFIDSFETIFAPQIPYDSCYFLYCFLIHINAFFERELDVINVKNLCSNNGEKNVFEKMSQNDRISFQNILLFKQKFDSVFYRALLYIECSDEETRKKFIKCFPCLQYPKGFDVLLFFKLLDVSNFYNLCSKLSSLCGLSFFDGDIQK